ncbi:MAG TPA: PilZ domain-containing protein [Gemmataceae bacterium]|nr:PilZ domain-containing protein [Gemmataceae bacterium]
MSQHADTSEPSQGSPTGVERRAWVRYRRLREARVHTNSTPTCIFEVAVIRQVSAKGLSLFLTSRVAEGTILEVEPKGIGFPRPLLARVVHVVPQANGWVYGCELADRLSDAELQVLLG